MKLPSQSTVMVVGGVIGIAAVGWFVSRILDRLSADGALTNIGANVGSGVVDLSMGVLGGVNDAIGIPRTSDVVDWANSSSNPLQPVGAWIGGTLYDLTH